MNDKTARALCVKYPELFRKHPLTVNDPPELIAETEADEAGEKWLPFYFECQDGWVPLLDRLAAMLWLSPQDVWRIDQLREDLSRLEWIKVTTLRYAYGLVVRSTTPAIGIQAYRGGGARGALATQINLNFLPDQREAIDRMRGAVPTSTWIRDVLLSEITQQEIAAMGTTKKEAKVLRPYEADKDVVVVEVPLDEKLTLRVRQYDGGEKKFGVERTGAKGKTYGINRIPCRLAKQIVKALESLAANGDLS